MRPDLPGLDRTRFASSIRVHVSGGGAPDDEYDVSLDCQSGGLYCRVLCDCTAPAWSKGDWRPVACTCQDPCPVGVCTEAEPADSS